MIKVTSAKMMTTDIKVVSMNIKILLDRLTFHFIALSFLNNVNRNKILSELPTNQ